MKFISLAVFVYSFSIIIIFSPNYVECMTFVFSIPWFLFFVPCGVYLLIYLWMYIKAYETSYLNQSKREEYETGLSVSHYHQEHIEYILRGYSSLLPNNNKNNNNNSTIVHLQSKSETNIDVDSNMKEEEMERVVNKMIQLVERMEDEGRVYVDLRSKLRSQMAHVRRQERQAAASAAAAAADDADNTAASEKREGRASSNLISNSDSDSSSSSGSDSDDDGDDATEENREAWKMVQLVENYGAPPGPSAAMYDLTLDAIANVIHNTSDPIPYLQKSMELFERSLSRNELDRKQDLDVVNLKSMPTAATFNAVIRISSNVVKESGSGSSNEQVRDVAVTNAFTAFHAMDVHPHVHRNSATYNYLVRTVDKFFPACKAKGHILATVWDDCVFKDAVLDENVIKAFLDVKYEDCGEDIHFYFTKRIADVYDPEVKNGYGFPVKYSRNKKKRRFDKALDVY